MRQYITGKAGLARLLTVVLTTSLLTVLSCSDEIDKTDRTHNLSMDFSTRAGETGADLVPTIRLFNFHRTGTDDKKFYQEVFNLKRSDNKVTANVEAGQWNMALVSTPYGGTVITPEVGTLISDQPLYKYEPIYTDGAKTTDADEIFLDNQSISITGNTQQAIDAQLNRTVARVDLIIKKTTPNFVKVSAKHKIKLHNVPSTISYTGNLLPSATAPAMLSRALEAPVSLEVASSSSYQGTETITFIIPAHRGDTYTSSDPSEFVGVKMDVELILERTGGTMFEGREEISIVAQCNKILEVEITVNDGLEFKTNILNWESVGLDSKVGAGYQNWLYVKQGSNGNGLSWSDPLPSINAAIAKAQALNALGADKKVNGILVAGGPEANMLYNEGLNIPANIKIYGGWKGTPNTELAYNDVEGPYTAPVEARNLSTHKAIINLGDRVVQLANANSVLDGFIVQGATAGNTSAVTVSNPEAWINAIEIKNNANTSGTVLTLSGSNTTATNILVSNNTRGVNVGVGAKLVNATVVKNNAASTFAGSLLNSVYWGNLDTPTISGIVNYCAFNGTHTNMPAGTNYPMHATNNTAWIVQGSPVPGPHFADANADFTALSNRAPMLGRGDEDIFADAVTGKMPVTNYTDINGNPRSYETIDIGCYESPGTMKGFEFRWNMTDVYISTKKDMESDHPALLFDNSEGAYVEWRIEPTPTGTLFTVASGSPTSGAGTGTTLGYFYLKSGPTANSSNTDRPCGTIKFVSDNLGVYLPDNTKNVYQTPGESAVWNEGYAGSFHRWNETGPRYIYGEHPYEDDFEWSVRIISGHEWIKIDGKGRPSNPDNDTEVEETFGGFVKGRGNIIFRIGMKSTLSSASSTPRYGLISITKRKKIYTSSTSGSWTKEVGNALFFVRQGEAADYLYRPGNIDPRPLGSRTEAIKFSPYNLTDPQGRFVATGVALGKNGGRFVQYPSMIGYFFKWNGTDAYYPDNSIAGTNVTNTYKSGSWDSELEVCPANYFTPTDPQFVHSYFLNRNPGSDGSGSTAGTTFVWGRYADGYYDKYADVDAISYGTGPMKAANGLLMYNDYNNASVFFPMAGKRESGSSFYYISNDRIPAALQWTQTSSPKGYNTMWHTHSYGTWYVTSTSNGGHLGMACTPAYRYHALSVRCVQAQD